MDEEIVIGIDLGTTNTCVACYINGELKILENALGNYLTASYVYIAKKDEVVVGQLAKRMSIQKPEHGIYEIKRFIGRQFSEIESRQDISKLSFVLQSIDNEPKVFLESLNMYLSPVEICSLILSKVKSDVCEKLEEDVKAAVITVPAHFTVSQRKATLEAARRAGFKILRLLNEPTAAALNYFHETRGKNSKYNLVYDLGGGTFDVAILAKNNDSIDVVCIDGDSYLGGCDFDDIIQKYLLQEMKEKYGIIEKFDRRELRRLKKESETCKETLSATTQVYSNFEAFHGHDLIEIDLERDEFERLIQPLIERSIEIVDRCIKNSNLEKNDVEEIILAGGSTLIPKVQEALKKYFNGRNLIKILHPAECVAKGAALQAAMLSKNPRQKLRHFRITEVTSSSLGVADVAQKMNFVIKKNTPIPTSKSIRHATVIENQTQIHFKIYEGEKWNVNKNNYLGELRITNLSPAPPGQCEVTITMTIDENGILTVRAQEKNKDNIRDLQTTIVKTKVNSKIYTKNQDDEDEHFIEFAKIKRFLVVYSNAVLYNFRLRNLVPTNRKVYERCRQINEEVLSMDVTNEDRLRELLREIQNKCEPLIKQYNFIDIPSEVVKNLSVS